MIKELLGLGASALGFIGSVFEVVKALKADASGPVAIRLNKVKNAQIENVHTEGLPALHADETENLSVNNIRSNYRWQLNPNTVVFAITGITGVICAALMLGFAYLLIATQK